MEDHNLKRLLDKGLMVTVNSDDPAYFGGYIADNYLAAQSALGLTQRDIVALAHNSVRASFMTNAEKRHWFAEIDLYADRNVMPAA
jgi:adenosine deaminase